LSTRRRARNPRASAIPLGDCQCGCGRQAPIAGQTRSKLGWVKGQPVRFINGHSNRRQQPSWLAERYVVSKTLISNIRSGKRWAA